MVRIIMSQTVMQKDDFAVFQGQGHSDGSYDYMYISS